jgi:hypothetical protein
MGHDVFVSYPSPDKTIADAICGALEQNGIRCWVAPRDVLPGQVWAAAIVEAISACRVMVLIVSEATDRSTHVAREVERAADRELVIVPFRVCDAKLNGTLEYFLQSRHWLDAMTPPLEAHIARLCDVVSRLLAPAAGYAPRRPTSGPVRVTVHLAYFARTGTPCCFINVTNLCQDVDVEITHVWVEAVPQVFAHNRDRPLPKRLRPHESWETWIPADRLNPDMTEAALYQAARVRVSTGEVVPSVRNDSVPAEGMIPGGPIGSPP